MRGLTITCVRASVNAPAPEPGGEMSREAFEAYPQLLVQMAFRFVPAHVAALRERCRRLEEVVAQLIGAGMLMRAYADNGYGRPCVVAWDAAVAAAEAVKPAPCKDGIPHAWGTDGQHSNEFCKVCYVDRPKAGLP